MTLKYFNTLDINIVYACHIYDICNTKMLKNPYFFLKRRLLSHPIVTKLCLHTIS